jgi:hypothetical protein
MNTRFGSFLIVLLFICALNTLQAQVLVHEEPKHRPVLVTPQIRILDVVMAPGDTSIYHIHHTPSLFILFSNTTTGSVDWGKAPSTGKTTAGTMLYEDLSAPNTRTHRVWNADKDTFHVMDIELLASKTGFKQAPLANPALKLEIDNAYVRAYQLSLGKGQGFRIRDSDRSFILISYGNIGVNTHSGNNTMKPGSFIELKQGEAFMFTALAEGISRFALIELPGN